MPKPYQLKKKTEDVYELLIYGFIGDSWMEESVAAKEVVTELKGVDAKEIIVCINSYGGSIADGTAMINALIRHPAKIITRNEGVAVSMGASIFMAGDERQAYENVMTMFHAPLSGIVGNAVDMRKQADVLEKFAEVQVPMFLRKTNLKESDIRELLFSGEDHWFSPEELQERGLSTEIIDSTAQIEQSTLTDMMQKFPSFSQSGFANNKVMIMSGTLNTNPEALMQSINKEISDSEHLVIEQRIAEGDTGAASAEPQHVTKQEVPMDPKVNEVSAEQTEAQIEQAKSDATAAERSRASAIKSKASKFNLEQSFVDDLIDSGVNVEQANDKILEKLATTDEIQNKGRIEVVEDQRDRFMQGATKGMLMRAGVEKNDHSNEYRKYGFKDMARLCLEQSGVSTRNMSSDQILQAATTHSTGDFANIFENVMHKTLLDQFNLASHTWREFCGTSSVSDFRAHNRYKPSSFGDLKTVQENGEFKDISIGDAEKETISASSKGFIFNLSFEMLKNDDMGAFVSVSRGFGRAAARSVENDVYAQLLANPVMGDGVALFHGTHGNLPTGAAISMTSLDAARVLMRKQKDPGGKDFLDISPAVLLCPVELGGLARQTIVSETDPSQSNSKKPNIVRDMAKVVDTPRLSGTGWYLFASPSDMPSLEVAFLDGVTEPEVTFEESFRSRGIAYRIAYDYGVGAVEYRGGLYNAGA